MRKLLIPRLVCLITLTCLAAPAARAQTMAERIDEVMRRYYDLGLFHGSILVAKDGEVVYERGYGYANLEWQVPNTPDTRLHLASITKMFTATLVLQQVERGAIRLDAPITEYLVEYPADPGDRITVHHLLSHTSGIPDFANDVPEYATKYAPLRQPADTIMADMARRPLEFEPGERYDYSNTGYVLLGMILERVTGADFCTLLYREILEPAGMTASGCASYEAVIPHRAEGYERTEDGFRRPLYDHSIHADGMMYSTVQDLFRFDRAMTSGALLSEATQAIMNTPREREPMASQLGGPDVFYGYGVMISNVSWRTRGRTVTVLSHPGLSQGFSTLFVRIPEDGITVAVLNNVHRTLHLYLELFNILYDQPYKLPTRERLEAQGPP